MKRKGFTLIELLVVIAIIAILAAILFPVFAKAREKARTSSCQSNLKQLSLAVMQYTHDFDEKYPGRYNSGNEAYSWRVVIQPYLKSTQAMVCPSNPINNQTTMDNVTMRSYACNGWDWHNAPMCQNDPNNIWLRAAKQSDIVAPAQCILLCESIQNWSEMPLDGAYSWGWTNNGKYVAPMYAGHMGQSNFAFCDGHVKTMKPSATVSNTGPVNMWDYNGPTVAPWGNSVTELNNATLAWQ